MRFARDSPSRHRALAGRRTREGIPLRQHCGHRTCADSISGMGISAVCFCECRACRAAMLETDPLQNADEFEPGAAAHGERRRE